MSKERKREKGCNLQIDEIRKKLCTYDNEVVNEIYNISCNLLKEEKQRSTELDSKSSNLAGIIGVCITIVFALGGLLIERIQNASIDIMFWLVFLYILVFVFALIALTYTLWAVKARSDYKTVTDKDIFSKQLENGITTYKRYLISHYWQIYQNNFKVNENKGCKLKTAYDYFLISLIFLLPVVIIIGLYCLTKGGF